MIPRCLSNLWATITHEHNAHCWTVWSAHAAAYCWICDRAVTDDPVPGYAIVYRDTGAIAHGHRGGVPTVAFFLTLREANSALWAPSALVYAPNCEVIAVVADRQGIRPRPLLETP